jgi:hypothetical protein
LNGLEATFLYGECVGVRNSFLGCGVWKREVRNLAFMVFVGE